MLYQEYAIEPEGFMRNLNAFMHITDKLGVDKGRLVCELPADWQDVAQKHITVHGPKRTRYVERLRKLALVSRVSSGKMGPDWLRHAEEEHDTQPFKAILASDNPRGHQAICRFQDIFELGTEEIWNLPRDTNVPRQANRLVEVARGLIRLSSSFLIVDQYYNPVKHEYYRPLQELFRTIQREAKYVSKLEVHCGAKGKDNSIEPKTTFERHCQLHLTPLLPSGLEVEIYRWSNSSDQEKPHPRYFLTEKGGLHYDWGFAEDPNNCTKVSRLDDAFAEEELFKFNYSLSPYKLVDAFRFIGK